MALLSSACEVLLKAHQRFQKPVVIGGVKEMLARLSSR